MLHAGPALCFMVNVLSLEKIILTFTAYQAKQIT